MHILLAEDDSEYRNVLREALELDGHVVYAAEDGTEAYKLLAQHECGLVISDINMPNCTGTQLHELIRSHEPYRKIPFIYITGVAILRVATPLAEIGFDYMVSKVPFDRLLQLIDDISLSSTTLVSNDASMAWRNISQ